MNQELKINLTVDAATGIATLKSFGDNADAHLKRVEGAGQSMATSLKSNWIAASAAIGAAGAVMYKAWNLAEKAAQFEEMEAGLQGLSSRYGMTAESAIQMAKAAVDGQLSMMEAGKLAAKSFALGLNPDQVKTFLVQAERLTDVMGGQIPEAFEAMEKAAATGRSKGLVQYGINVDLKKSLEDYAAAHGIAKESISASTAMQVRSAAVMEATKRVTDQLGEATTSTADRMNKMRATVADIELIMGQFAIRGGAAIIGIFQGMAAAAMVLTAGVFEIGKGITWLMSKISGGVWTEWYEEMKVSSEAAWEASKDLTSKSTASLQAAFAERKVLASSMKKLRDEENKEVSEGAKKAAQEREQATKSIVEEIRKASIDIEGIGKDQFTKDMARLASEVEKYKKAGVDKVLIAQYVAAETTVATKKQEEETLKMWRKAGEEAEDAMKKEIDAGVDLSKETLKRIKERGESARDLYKDMKGYEHKYFDESIKLIDDQAKRYKDLGIDEVAIAKWRADQVELAEIAKLKASGKFFDGVKAGYRLMQRDQKTWADVGLAMYQATQTAMASSFSTMFEDVYQGKMKSIGDYTGAIWDSVRKKFFDLVGTMASEKIMAGFELAWSGEGSSSVLKILDKILGWGGDYLDDLNLGQYAGVTFAHGGMVPGYASGGDSKSNDTVPAWLSPGEFVMPRSAVNADTKELLEYIRSSGKAPGFAGGGMVSGLIDNYSQEYFSNKYLPPMFDATAAQIAEAFAHIPFPGYMLTNIRQGQAGIFGAGGQAQLLADGYISTGMGSYKPYVNPKGLTVLQDVMTLLSVATMGYGLLGGAAAGAAGTTAAGTTATSSGRLVYGSAEYLQALADLGMTEGQIALQTGTGGMMTALMDTANPAYWSNLADQAYLSGSSALKEWVVKQAIKQALGMVTGGGTDGGYATASFGGFSGGDGLSKLMDLGGIVGMSGSTSARNGLDYIPRDNFRANLHEGEAVLTKKENAARKKGEVSIVNHFNFPNALTVDRSAINDLAEKIYPRLKRLEQWGH